MFIFLRSLHNKCVFKIKGQKLHLYVIFYGNIFSSFRCNVKRDVNEMVRVLNVAEKNDAAKSIAELMSNGRYRRRNGLSVYNKIYEYEYNLFNQRCTMIMTSVSGHLLNLEFVGSYRVWKSCNPVSLFNAPVALICEQNYQPIKSTLEKEVKNCQHLVIWTDCDREGENIGFEIIDVCKKVKPGIKVHRAKFSEITQQAITRACRNLCAPDSRINDAVNVRRELDLRIGASFTRFQTLRLQSVFPDILGNQLISYGSCQFPTLGFVVERYKQVQSFIPEPFWKLKVTHKKDDVTTEFSWKRGRLFDHTACLVFYQICLEQPTAKVVDIRSRNKSKWRPQPLDTVELEKLASRKLRINAKEALNVAEKLYTKGFISYPRTETTIFPKELDLVALVQMQTVDQNWGEFANRVLENGPNPRQGNKTDNAHPPIHPIKYTNSLQGNEKTIYEFVVRHFLACVSKDAEGKETTIEIDVNSERFAVNGLMIIAKNYLEVYPYEKWNAKIIAEYSPNEEFQPSSIEMIESETKAPDLLTEADLIALMEKHGIGTDATHAEHIETIKQRLYVGVNENGRFVPGELGMGLVEGYDLMGFAMSKPNLRAELEADLKRICDGCKNPEVVLKEQIEKYKRYFIEAVRQAAKIDSALSNYFQTAPGVVEGGFTNTVSVVMKCPKCSGDITLRTKKDNRGYFLSCMTYPGCNAVIWFPDFVEDVVVTSEACEECVSSHIMKLKLKVKRGSLLPFYEDEVIACVGGCDPNLMAALNIRPITPAVQNTLSSVNSIQSSQAHRNNRSQQVSSDRGYNTMISNRTSHNNNNNHSNSTNHLSEGTSTFLQRFSFSSSQSNDRGPLRPVNNISDINGPSTNNEVVCNCGESAVLLTVKKEGPNKGRHFYKCPQRSENQCDFFLWKEESSSVENFGEISFPYAGNTDFRNVQSEKLCDCGSAPKLLTVQKDGSNKGRKFYVCSKPRDQGCKYFDWADGAAAASSSTTFNNNFEATTSRRRANSVDRGNAPKRKCGLCNEKGHNRRNCPLNS